MSHLPSAPSSSGPSQEDPASYASPSASASPEVRQGRPQSQEPDQRILGAPLSVNDGHRTRVLLLGSGELGREITIELMRLGAWVCAADSYGGAPAQQVAHEGRVVEMSNADALQGLIESIRPDVIIPEVEAIATQVLKRAAEKGIQVAPSSAITAMCMNREELRIFAHETLGLPTTPYRFASSLEELRSGAEAVGFPCVVKPVMSSSGHGQSVVSGFDEDDRSREWACTDDDVEPCHRPVLSSRRSQPPQGVSSEHTHPDPLENAWNEAQTGRRAARSSEVSRVIVEALAPLSAELTVITISSAAGVSTCEPIGQRQEHGDYRESWQPAGPTEALPQEILEKARHMAQSLVEGMVRMAQADGERGWGVYGVELFVLNDGSLLFNEVSPRPHDTGMVTMISQRLSEFALQARVVLGIPVTQEHLAPVPGHGVAASRAIVVQGEGEVTFSHVDEALAEPGTDLRIFSKPRVKGHRRMAVALAVGENERQARTKAEHVAASLRIGVD